MISLADRIQETCTSSGTGDLLLNGADTGYRAFGPTIATLARVPYGVVSGNQWEVGLGQYLSGTPNRIVRQTVYASSNGNALVNFDASEKKVFLTFPAALLPFRELTADPADPNPGETWFNSTSNTFKGAIYGLASWESSGTINGGGAIAAGAGGGSTTAGLWCGGIDNGPTQQATTQLYDGTSFSATGAMPTTKYYHSVFGTQTAMIATNGFASGTLSNSSISFNGTAWSSSAASGTTVEQFAALGTATAGMKAGGRNSVSATITANCEQFNGTAWSSSASLTGTMSNQAGGGSISSGYVWGGSVTYTVTQTTTTTSWNGVAWAAGPALNVARVNHGGWGNLSEATAAGGSSGASTSVSKFDGAAWSAGQSMGTARVNSYAIGATARSGVMAGGLTTGSVRLSSSEKYTYPQATTRTFTIA